MENYKLALTEQGEKNISETVATLIEAAEDIAKAQEADFEKIKAKKWYKRLWELVTFSKDNEKIQARGVANLAKLNDILMKAIVIVAKQGADTAERLSQGLSKIEEINNEINTIYDGLKATTIAIKKIQRGFSTYIKFDELSENEQEVIVAIYKKVLKEVNISNEYTQKLSRAVIIHDFTNTPSYEVIEDISSDAQKILYNLIQGYFYLATDDFGNEDQCEVFEYIGLSKRETEKIKENIKSDIFYIGKDGYINFFVNEPEEYYLFDGFGIEFDEIEEEITESEDSLLKKTILKYADSGIGELITDQSKFFDILTKVDSIETSINSVIAIFKAEKYLVFTTYAMYYEGLKSSIPYCSLNLNNIFIKSEDDNDQSLIINDNKIFDSVIDENTLKDLVVEICDLDNSNYSKTDKISLLKDLDKTIQINFLAALVYLVKQSKKTPAEVYRIYLLEKYNFSWDVVLNLANEINNDEQFYALVEETFNNISDSSKHNVSAEVLIIAISILTAINDNAALNVSQEKLLKAFDINNLEVKDRNAIFSLIEKFEKIASGKDEDIFYFDKSDLLENTIQIFKNRGIILSIYHALPILSDSNFMFYFHKKLQEYFTKEGKILMANINYIHKDVINYYINSYRNILQNSAEISEELYNEYLNDIETACIYWIDKYCEVNGFKANENYYMAVLANAPELLFTNEKADEPILVEELSKGEELYFNYKIDDCIPYFEMASNLGCSKAYYYLGEIFAWGYGNVKKDIEKAKEYRRKGAELGDVLAALNYGYMQDDANFKKSIFNFVFPLLKNLADNGNIAAQYELSDMYFKGIGTTQNIDKGLKYLKEAADNGHFKSINKLGTSYWLNKNGAKKDKEKAVEYWKKAADLGYEPSIYNLYKQKSLYQKEFDKLCDRGFHYALNYRAYQYMMGYSPYSKDKELALKDLKRAVELGNKDAVKNLKLLENQKNTNRSPLGALGLIGSAVGNMFAFSYEFDPLF